MQIDHMRVVKNNIRLKHFQAWDSITKTLVAEVYGNATSIVATKFLLKVIQKLPLPLKSIQVDGGSEFMLYFEKFCSENNIPLFVIPPSRPQYNGGVECKFATLHGSVWSMLNGGKFPEELRKGL